MATDKTRLLYVPLTREEVEERSARLARKVQEHDEVKEQKRSLTAELSTREKNLQKDRAELADVVRTKRELRVVDVFERANVELRTWEIVRADTKEVVEARAMTDLEVKEHRQGKLFKIDGKKTGTDDTKLHPAPLTSKLPLPKAKKKKGDESVQIFDELISKTDGMVGEDT